MRKNITFRSVFLLPIACYALGSALVVALAPELMHTAWREVLIYSVFLSPALILLGIRRFLKKDRSASIMISSVLGTLGTFCWIYVFWVKSS